MTCPTTLWLATIGDVTHLVRPDPLTALVRQPRLVGGVLIAMAVMLAICAIVSLVRRDRARQGPTFRRMCRALRIRAADRRRLQDLARTGRAPAASLLVSRGCFDAAVSRLAAGRRRAGRLAAVRRRVFE